MNTESKRKRGECVCIEIPMETGAAAAAGTADSAVSLCPEIQGTTAVTQADSMDIPVIPAAARTKTAAVLTAVHGILTVIPVIPAILVVGRNAGLGVMWWSSLV